MRSRTLHSLQSLALLAIFSVATAKPQSQEPTRLRGYGTVQAHFQNQRAVFQCDSSEKADILLGKMLADLFWDAGSKSTPTNVSIKGVNIPIRSWEPYGALAVFRVGTSVLAVGASDVGKLKTRLESEGTLFADKPSFAPSIAYPRYLDMYDLRAFKAYTYAMRGNAGMSLDSHWPFLKKFGMDIAFQALSTRQSPAPGVYAYGPIDYEFGMANKNDGIASVGITGGGEVPLWVYNRMPDGIAQPSPTTLLSAWFGTGATGSHYESWGLTPEEKATGSQIFMVESMKRYLDNPALGAWQLYAGTPGAEYNFHDRFTQFLDYSPRGEDSFRNWLKNVRHYDLQTLGLRWFANANRYASWDQVKIPDVNAFYGDLRPVDLRLQDGWQFATARNGNETPPVAGDPSWIPVNMPPSQQQVLLPWGEAFFKCEFDATAWEKKECWLVCDSMANSKKPTEIWLNGAKIADEKSNMAEFSVAVTGLLKPGKNELIIRVPRKTAEVAENNPPVFEGRINGPVFLTLKKPQRYPNLGKEQNAMFYDFHEWQADAINQSHIGMMNIAMALDPNHPFILSGGAGLLGDKQSELAEKYGCAMQFTGQEGYYNPWWPGVGLLGGFYGTSEESGQTNSDNLDRVLGWMMFDAQSNHCMFLNIDLYQKEEQKTGWFTKNKRAIQLFGKFQRPMPDIAIFVSSRDERTGSREPWNWDLGRGELQAMHYDNAYATETQLLNGDVDACPVLIDDGTDTMDQDVLKAVQRYVEKGGTFIALHQTGQHDVTNPDLQPLSVLTGLVSKPHAAAKLQFTPGIELRAMTGQSVTSNGVGLYPANPAFVVPGSEVTALASFADGTIAIGERKIGKGKIIQVGSQYWRDNGPKEMALIGGLLSDLGVKRTANASNPKVWARKVTTKNGLQDWVIAYNNNESATETADVSLAAPNKPDQVWDMLTDQPVDSTYENGFVTVHNVSFGAKGMHIFGIKRADLADGLATWWAEKARYWKVPVADSTPEVTALRSAGINTTRGSEAKDIIAFDKWKFLADRDGSVEGTPAWTTNPFDDKKWSTISNGPWNYIDAKLADWKGASLYRSEFNIPGNWPGRKILLHLYSYDLPIAYDHADFYLNGTKVGEYQARTGCQNYSFDVSGNIHPGANVLAIHVVGGKDLAGFNGNVWIQPELNLASQVSLEGTWNAVGTDFKTLTQVAIPGKPNARYIYRDFDLVSDWKGKSVYARIDTTDQWLGLVVVNGHLIDTNSYLQPFMPSAEVNLTPYLVPGRNRIELWPFQTVPSPFQPSGQMDTRDMPIQAIHLGVL